VRLDAGIDHLAPASISTLTSGAHRVGRATIAQRAPSERSLAATSGLASADGLISEARLELGAGGVSQ